MRLLVCGGRDFANAGLLEDTLNEYFEKGPLYIIHGGARGADGLAGDWAKGRGVEVDMYLAQWDRDGRAAGPIRNKAMLVNGRPDLIIAFEGGKGTANMISQAKKAGVEVREVTG